MVGRAALISFPSSLSLMRYTDPISYSAFLSTRAQKWLEGMLAKTVWPSQWVRHHTAGAEGPLPLPSALETEESSVQGSPPYCWDVCPPRVQGLLAHLCCQIPTLQTPGQRRNTDPRAAHLASEMQLLLLLSLACSMEPAGVWIRPFPSKTGGMLMFKIK